MRERVERRASRERERERESVESEQMGKRESWLLCLVCLLSVS